MIPLPPEPSLNKPIIDWALQVQKFLRRVRPASAPGLKEGTDGWTISNAPNVAASSTATIHPFQAVFPSPFIGEGEPPSDQALRFKVRPGIISAWSSSSPRLATNLTDELTALDDQERYYCWIEANFTSDGQVVSLADFKYAHGAEVPEPEFSDTEDDVYPTKWCLPIFALKTEGGAIKSVEEYVQTSLSISIVVTSVECGKLQRGIFWSRL